MYNDILKFNSIIGKALIENRCSVVDEQEIQWLLTEHKCDYPKFIEKTFDEIYFTREENHWLDVVSMNIRSMTNEYKNMAYFALFQSCIIKRPYNLFHRKNLYIRLQEVKRSFGNKKTWDTPFETHFRRFMTEANRAVFDSGVPCYSINRNVFDICDDYDWVYIDSPYISSKGIGVNYGDFYHFLEGLVDYDCLEN